MQLINIVLVLTLVAAASCYHQQEHNNREIRQTGQVDHGRRIILPTWKPHYHHNGGAQTYRVKRDNSVGLTAEHVRHEGIKLNADAQARLWTSSDRRSQLDANANYNRQFGGHGSGNRDYGAGIRYQHNF